PHDDVSFAIHRILREAVRNRHGGAFAILPNVSSALKDRYIRTISYQIEPLDLGKELFSGWVAVCRVWNAMKGHPELHNVVNAERIASHRWLAVLDAVSGMASADGCVVIDRGLVVYGFGGSINADDMAGGPDRLCRNTTSNRKRPVTRRLVGRGRVTT